MFRNIVFFPGFSWLNEKCIYEVIGKVVGVYKPLLRNLAEKLVRNGKEQKMFSSIIRDYFKENSKQFIAVCGCARSGTTLMFDYLNEFEDIRLVCEDNPFIEDRGYGYRSWYNSHWSSQGKIKTKGYYLPSWGEEDGFWFDYYYQMSKRYKFFGTKLAFGPHGDSYWNSIDRRALSFFQENFPYGLYLLTVRHPAESIFSMMKMFPGADFGTLNNTWIKSLQIQLSIYGSMKRSSFIFLEDINISFLDEINKNLGIDSSLAKTEEYIIANNKKSSSIIEEIPEMLKPYAAQISEINKAYAFLRKDIGKNGEVNGWVHREEFCRSMWHALEYLRADSNAHFTLS